MKVQVRLFSTRSTYVGIGRIGLLCHIAAIGTIGSESTFSMNNIVCLTQFQTSEPSLV